MEQRKLELLLKKISDLLVYCSDKDCQQTFQHLASFARRAIEVRDKRRESHFNEMDLEELINLDNDVLDDDKVSKVTNSRTPKKRQGSTTPPRVSEKKKKQKDSHNDEEEVEWNLLEYYNIRSIVSITEGPLQIHLEAKPGRAGNHKAKRFYATPQHLKQLTSNNTEVS